MTHKFNTSLASKPQNDNDLWCDSSVLGAKVFLNDLPELLPKHRIALHDEVHQRLVENNVKFESIDKHFRRYRSLPENIDRSWWTSFKGHRAHLRAFYKALCIYIPDDKVALRNERVEREAQRAEASRERRFIKAQAKRTKDHQFIQVLCTLLTEEFGEEEIQPVLDMAKAAARILHDLNPPQSIPQQF